MKIDLAICAFIFTSQKPQSQPSKHAVCLVMPDDAVKSFLVYYPIIVKRIPPMLERFRILQTKRVRLRPFEKKIKKNTVG